MLSTDSPDASTSQVHGRIKWKEVSTLAPLHVALQEAQRAEHTMACEQATSRASEDVPSPPHSPSASGETISRRSGPRFLVQQHDESRSGSAVASPAEERAGLLPNVSNGGFNECGGPAGPLIIVTGRSRRLAAVDHRMELKEMMAERGSLGGEVRKTLGDVASAFVASSVGSAVLVLQAAGFNGD